MSARKHIYFVRPVGMDGPIKIGISAVPTNRLLELSVWSPYPLEIIGTVPGTTNDENFLHRAFSGVHSHREWFHSSPKLRAVIKAIVEADDMKAGRALIDKQELGTVRKTVRIVREPAHQRFLDLQRAVIEARRSIVTKKNEPPLYEPKDVAAIIKRWNAQVYRGSGFSPTDTELARVQEFIDDPVKHAAIPEWWFRHRAFIPQSVAAVPHVFEESAA